MRQIITALLGATALSVAFVPGAFAADMQVKAPVAPPTYDWTGFYAGVNAGYGSGRAPTSVALNPVEADFIAPVNNPLPGTLHPSGFIGGGQIGYNHQFGSIVAGLETDLSYAGLRKTDSATGASFIGGVFTTAVETKLDWFGTFRARLGILPTNNLLVYGTSGLAYGGVRTTTTGTNLPAINCDGTHVYCATGSTSGVSAGWTAGGGLEYAFARQWTVKAEYLYLDLGNRSVTFSDVDVPGGTLTARTNFKAQLVRAGVNYRF